MLPGILYILYSIVMLVTDKLILKKYYFLADGSDRDFDPWYQYCGFTSMLFYFLISMRYYGLFKKLMKQVISYADTVLFKWECRCVRLQFSRSVGKTKFAVRERDANTIKVKE